jgi:small redox-active disulfide protein 2
MEIKILGPGCSKCKVMTSQVLRAVDQMQIKAHVTKVEDLEAILAYGVMSTPALVVDGVVKVAGRIASVDEIKKILSNVNRK